mmetsp:Transcript_26796/g.73662  ORF Transcript_26796/g.73662 Transcript_26796/m.73662 type:complete len:308 (-) Transcript_26796:256-1179(-)
MNLVRSINTWVSFFTVAKSMSQTSPCESNKRLPPCKSLWHKPRTTCRSNLEVNLGSWETNSLKNCLAVLRFPQSSRTKQPSGSRSSISGGLRNPAPKAWAFFARLAPSAARFSTPWPTKRTILYMDARSTFFTDRLDMVNPCMRLSRASLMMGTTSTLRSLEVSSAWITDAKVCTGGAEANSGSPNIPPHRSICISPEGSCGSTPSRKWAAFTLGVVSPKSPPYWSVNAISSLTFSSVSNFKTEDGIGVPSFLIGEKKKHGCATETQGNLFHFGTGIDVGFLQHHQCLHLVRSELAVIPEQLKHFTI